MRIVNRLLDRANLSANRRKVVLNVSWAVLGRVVQILSGLLVGVLVARYLGPENFGLMSYVISFVTLFSVLAAFGLDNIEVRELSKRGADRDTLLGTAFVLRLAFAAGTMGLILLTLLRFESDRFTAAMVLVYSVSLLFGAFNGIRNYFTSIIQNEYVVKTQISRTVIGALIKGGLLLARRPVSWFIVASVLDFALVAGGYVYSYRRVGGALRAWRFDAAVARMLSRESFPMLLSGTASVFYVRINAVMIRHLLDNAAVGHFAVAERFMELGIFVPVTLALTVTPLLVQARQEDRARYEARRQQFLDVMVWGSMAVALALCLLAEPAIRLLFGPRYLPAIPVLQILAWKTAFMGLFSASGQVIIIQNQQRYAVLRNLSGCAVSVMLNLLLIPRWGLRGSALATVAALAVSGYLAHGAIPLYRPLFRLQTRALFLGWRRAAWFRDWKGALGGGGAR